MCQACIPEKNAALEERMKIDREAYKNYQKQSAAAESEPVSIPKEEPKMKEVVSTPPATFQSWLFGVLSGGQDSWIMNYMNSEFYEIARNAIKERTGGRDIHVAILVCAALNAARVRIPVVLDALLNQVKSQVTSSVIISGYDSRLCRELMKLVLEKSEERRKLRRFRGEHEIRAKGGELQPVGGKTHNSFWHNGTHFTVEIYRPREPDQKKQKEKEKAENLDDTELFSRDVDVTARLTVRCWGHSREPITALFEDLEKRISESKNLTVVEMQARPGSDKSSFHMKRPLSTIDLDPKMMQDIIEDVELFFHKDSRNWYRNSGRPYRHGYLFAGPPGTGKTSLLIGIASHMNLPLYMINLQGMDDKDLREAFSRIPFRSCVALEDIDCVGVDVSNRGAKKPEPKPVLDPQSSEEASSSDDPQVLVLETLMTKFMDKQATANSEVLNQVKAIKTATLDYLGEDDPQVDEKKKSKGAAGKIVTLSGLLNVIDGVNATEGRLIIMTTNHPEKLDPALYRAGRVERKFEITYASKASSMLTFKRLFDNDVCKRYTSEAIDRFAQAFQAQFPSKSRITTAELSKYCGQYRGRPDIAVKEFSDWLQRGADKFSCPIDYTQLVDEEGIYNVPEPFDEQLLQVSACDLIDPVSAAASGIEVQVAADVQTKHRKLRFWNPIKALNKLLVDYGEYADIQCIEDSFSSIDLYGEYTIELSEDPLNHASTPELQDVEKETCDISSLSSSLSETGIDVDTADPSQSDRQAQIVERYVGLGLAPPPLGRSSAQNPSPGSDLVPEFIDADFGDDAEPLLQNDVSAAVISPASSEESLWDEAHHNQASPVRSVASVMFSEPGKLALASPRPIAPEPAIPEDERNDSAVDDSDDSDSDSDGFNTAEE